MPNLYRQESADPKYNAQRNLAGRTHYVDDETLRYHKSRVLSSRVHDSGLLFSIITSDSADYNNTRREFRYVIFDVFGRVLDRPECGNGYKTSDKARKAMYEALNGIDAAAHTLAAIEERRAAYARELETLAKDVERVQKGAA